MTPIYDQLVNEMFTPRTWEHSRKGRIHGCVLREDDTWMWIMLDGNHNLRYFSQAWREAHPVDFDGEILQVRKSLMQEVEP